MNAQTAFAMPPALDTSQMTPAERIEALAELVLTLCALEHQSAEAKAKHQAVGAFSPDADHLGDLSDIAVEREVECGAELIAHVKVLTGDGTLDRCCALLAKATPAA